MKIKTITTIGLLTCALSVAAQNKEAFSVDLNASDNLSVSKNINISDVQIIEGTEALLSYKNELENDLDMISQSDILRDISQSAVILEELIYIESLIKKQNSRDTVKTSVNGSSPSCGISRSMSYTFDDNYFNFNLNVSALTSAAGPFPPWSPYLFIKSTATTFNPKPNTDIDSYSANGFFSIVSSSVNSGSHSAKSQIPFVAQGTFFISHPYCDSFSIIKVEGTKSWAFPPVITSAQN